MECVPLLAVAAISIHLNRLRMIALPDHSSPADSCRPQDVENPPELPFRAFMPEEGGSSPWRDAKFGHDNAGTLAVELTLTSDRPVTLDITSAVVNRQDLRREDQVTVDPRRAGRHTGRVLQNLYSRAESGSVRLAWQRQSGTISRKLAQSRAMSPNGNLSTGEWGSIP